VDTGPLTITDAAPLIAAGKLTPSELLEQCLARIDRYEPRVKAWVYLDRKRARKEADELTRELKSGRSRGPLHGIPIGIKDIIDVFDMPTGCGSKLWANSYARQDATCVRRLREAGALILGKTVTTAYASFDPPVTRNPWNLERTPGGSSSGSAAAVACGMCLAALATQTGGSITRPASYCGVCSIKPTYGRVSVLGVLPLAPTMDHVGVMANCVRDLAMVYQTIAGPEPHLGFTFHGHGTIPDCLKKIDHDLSEGSPSQDPVRLGGMFDELTDPQLRELYDDALKRSETNLSYRSDAVPPAGFAEVLGAQLTIMAVEAAEYHHERMDRHAEDYPPRVRELIEKGSKLPAIAYRQARVFRDGVEEQITKMLSGCRVFVTPATTSLAPDRATTGDPAFNAPWSFTGHPTVSIPAGWSPDGLPFALQLIGSPMCEDDLLATAAWYERNLEFPRRPVPVP
jgi:aspartyl-tRNA(Asn)/glutamyl-tRNA(Gln) amidotransferase subunit A